MTILATDAGVIVTIAMAVLIGWWIGWKLRGIRERLRKKGMADK